MGSRLIESAAYCYQIFLAQWHIKSAQYSLVNWIIRLLLSLLCRPQSDPIKRGTLYFVLHELNSQTYARKKTCHLHKEKIKKRTEIEEKKRFKYVYVFKSFYFHVQLFVTIQIIFV